MFRVLLLLSVATTSGCASESGDRAPAANPFDARLVKPRGVAVGPSGRVFVVDMSGHISRFSAAGKLEHRWALAEQETGTPSGLFADDQGRLVVPDTHNSRVIICDADGNEITRFGKKGTGDGEFLFPTDVLVDREGFIYVSEYGGNDRISKFSPTLEFVDSFGTPDDGWASLSAPQGMTIDDAGTIWVADMGNHRICRFNRSGELLETIGGLGDGPGELRYPYDVVWVPAEAASASTCGGYLLVSEKVNQRIQVFTTEGACRGMWGRPGRSEGELHEPTGLGLMGGSRVLIADTGNDRLHVIALEDLCDETGSSERPGQLARSER